MVIGYDGYVDIPMPRVTPDIEQSSGQRKNGFFTKIGYTPPRRFLRFMSDLIFGTIYRDVADFKL